jgi:hypothetical protein
MVAPLPAACSASQVGYRPVLLTMRQRAIGADMPADMRFALVDNNSVAARCRHAGIFKAGRAGADH